MGNFNIIIVIVALIGVAIGLIFLIKTILSEINARKILQHGRKGENFIYDLLRTHYGASKIIRNAYYKMNNGYTTEIDMILVGKAGIMVFEIKAMKGFIDTPFKGDWCQMYNGKVLMFQNPFDQNVTHINAIKQILRKESIPNVKLHNIVVFTEPSVKFKHKEEMLLTSNRLLPFLADLNRNKFLKSGEIRNIAKILNKYKLSGKRVQRNHINNLRQ